MAKVATVGHGCVDASQRMPRPPKKNELLITPTLGISTGGLALSCARGMAIIGESVIVVCPIGNDIWPELQRKLCEQSGNIECLFVPKDCPSSTTLVSVIDGERGFCHSPGPNDLMTDDDVSIDLLRSKEVEHIHTGYWEIMAGMREDNCQPAYRLYKKAQEAGITVSMDGVMSPELSVRDWIAIHVKLLPLIDFYFPSIEEALLMHRIGSADQHDIKIWRKLACFYKDSGCRQEVGVKLGKDGVYCLAEDREFIAKPFREKRGPWPTGAGDAFYSGFIVGKLNGYPIEKCLMLAMAVSSCSVEEEDAVSGILSLKATLDRVDAGWELLSDDVPAGFRPTEYPGIYEARWP